VSKTKIEWTEATWNPVIGCTKCSPGCLNCYAERMARRQVKMGAARHEAGSENDDTWAAYSTAIDPQTGKWSGITAFRSIHPPKADEVFVCSMSDLFHENVPNWQLDFVFKEIAERPGQIFQILTKRTEEALNYLGGKTLPDNVWFGWTAEDQERMDERTPCGLQIPAAVRFVSLEPLLEDIEFKPEWFGACPGCGTDLGNCLRHELGKSCCPNCHHRRLDWVIVGCETGPGARPCKLEHVDHIVIQCEQANVPVFVKAVRDKTGRLVTDINEIGWLLGWPPEKLRQYPERNAK
jgi:protein gp37